MRQYDELGEMRQGYAAGVLLSQDFTKVDQHLWAAFSSGLETHSELSFLSRYLEKDSCSSRDESDLDGYEEMTLFCYEQMKKCRDTTDLAVKKFALLVCICTLESTQNFYRRTSDPRVFEPWLASLKNNLDAFIFGKHKNGKEDKCKSVSDSKYPNVASFVADMTSAYINL